MTPEMKNMRILALLVAVGLALFSATEKLHAVGFLLPNQDPEAIARGDAFAATADNPSAIYYNPAGITQMQGYNVRVGLYEISANTEYKSPSGASAHTDADLQTVPQFYFVDSLTNLPLSFGLGVYAPYGLGQDWGINNPFQNVAESGNLLYACLNPVAAWRVCKTLSVAVGPTINYSRAEFNRAIFGYPTQFKFTGDAMGYGMNAGILWQPDPKLSIGVNYRLATTLDYSGNIYIYNFPFLPAKSGAKASINFPQYIVGGISYRPTPKWNFEFDLNWADWSDVRQIPFEDSTLGALPPLTLDMKSSFIYDFGVTRQLGRGYFVSVGYIYSENSSPDANFSPLIPDANLSLGSVGFGHHGKHWDWAIAYHFAYGDRTVQNDSNTAADGTYHTFNSAFNIATTFKF